MFKEKYMEKWDAYDRFRRKLDFEIVRGEPIPNGVRHLVAHMVFYNDKGEILLQRRSDTKDLAPGVWAFTGGSALAGEDTLAACVRESREEMGIEVDADSAERIISYSRNDSFVDVFLIKTDVTAERLILQPEEVAEARWFSRSEFFELIQRPDIFWGYDYTDILIKYLSQMLENW